jgi:hypothetical protein
MVMMALLLIALISLALGLVLPSSAWLIASLIASGGAGYLLWQARSVIASAAKAAQAGETTSIDTAADAGAGDAGTAEAAVAPVSELGTGAATDAEDDEVWVIDGRPRYHLATCAIIQGQDAEPIPYDQATEDGFMACSLCEPNVALARSTA